MLKAFAQYLSVGLAVTPGFVVAVLLANSGLVGNIGFYVVGTALGILPASIAWRRAGAAVDRLTAGLASITSSTTPVLTRHFDLVSPANARNLAELVTNVEIAWLALDVMGARTNGLVAEIVPWLESEVLKQPFSITTLDGPLLLDKELAAGLPDEVTLEGSPWSTIQPLNSMSARITAVH